MSQLLFIRQMLICAYNSCESETLSKEYRKAIYECDKLLGQTESDYDESA